MLDFDTILCVLAGISLLLGALECFLGFRIVKFAMAVSGFFIGAALGIVAGIALDNTVLGALTVIAFGILFGVLAYKLYLVGVFITTAFWTALIVYLLSNSIELALLAAFILGILAVWFVRPVVIITTACAGAGVILSSVGMLFMDRSTFSLFDSANAVSGVSMGLLWLAISVAGAVIQFATTQKSKERYFEATGSFARVTTPSERRYPGMQRAYRNYCIKCGCQLPVSADMCPRCAYPVDRKG